MRTVTLAPVVGKAMMVRIIFVTTGALECGLISDDHYVQHHRIYCVRSCGSGHHGEKMKMKRLTKRQLNRLLQAMADYRATCVPKTVEIRGVMHTEHIVPPWSALEPFFPKGWTKDEVREGMNYWLIYKPFADAVREGSKKLKSRLAIFVKKP